jgi:F-type H+-transporting ATPase subunit delta
MKYTTSQYAMALHQAIAETKPIDQEKVLDNFVSVLKKNGDLAKIDEIEREFFKYEREAKGIKLAEVTTAKRLSGSDEEKLIKDLNEYVSGQVELKTKVDEGLVGGIVIRLGDEMIDGSVRKSLRELKNELIK